MTLREMLYAQIVGAKLLNMEQIGQEGPYDSVGKNFAHHCHEQAAFFTERYVQFDTENHIRRTRR